MGEFLVLTIDRVLPARTYRRNISGEIAMTTGTQSQLELTPQEAEAVLELWARKQAEGELRSRLNVQDLAEATGLSQNEIEKLVATVRASKSTPPAQSPIHAPVKRAKPVNYFLISVAVIVWVGILFSVAVIAPRGGRAQWKTDGYHTCATGSCRIGKASRSPGSSIGRRGHR